MDKKKDMGKELSKMQRDVPPQNTPISFDDKSTKLLADHVKGKQEKPHQKKRKSRVDCRR